jgi:phenylalanyl-tRNA synthetase beta chain
LRRVLGLVGISDFSMQLQPRTAFQPGMSAVCVVKQRTGTLSGEEQGTGLPVAHLPLSEVAYLGKLHPAVAAHYKLKKSVYLLEINLGLLFELLKPSRKYQPLPKYPSVDRDIAMIVSADIPYQSIREVIVKSAGNLAERVELFDLFSGQGISPGHYSLAVHVVYRDSNKTLSDEDVNRLHAQVLETLKNNLKIEIRM